MRGGQEHHAALPHLVRGEEPLVRPRLVGPGAGAACRRAQLRHWRRGAPAWLSPPAHEPPSKAFKDWATAWNPAHQANENSWAFTEPAIYYQARYVLLLSQFVAREKSVNLDVRKPAHRP